MKRCMVGWCVALLLVGCDGGGSVSDRASQLGTTSGAPVLSWPELEALESNGLLGVGYAFEKNDKAGAIAAVKDDSFKALVDALETAEAPSGVSGSAKDEVVKQARALIESAKGGDAAKFEEVYKQLGQAINAAKAG